MLNWAKTRKLPLTLALALFATGLHVTATEQPTYQKALTPSQFGRKLRKSLQPSEALLVANPLEFSPAMANWARQALKPHHQEQKAKALFELILHSTTDAPSSFSKPPTAVLAFQGLTNGASFNCQDLAFLYVALSRSVGLKSDVAFVDEDVKGFRMWHSCAALFSEEGVTLVDLAYKAYGIEHKSFRVLDDLHAAALYLCGSGDYKITTIACKLAPDFAFAHGTLFDLHVQHGSWIEARSELARLRSLEPDGLWTRAATALVLAHDGDSRKGIDLLSHTIAIAPGSSELRFWLGRMQCEGGDWTGAATNYLEAARTASSLQRMASAKAGYFVASAHQCEAQGDWQSALTNYTGAIAVEPEWSEAYLFRANLSTWMGDYQGAVADSSKAIAINPGLTQAYTTRAMGHHLLGQLDEALSDLAKAKQLSPSETSISLATAYTLYDQQKFTQSLAAFLDAGSAGSEDYTQLRIWLCRSRLGESSRATTDLLNYFATRTSTNTWPRMLAELLTGRLTENDLLTYADSTTQQYQAEARFYVGSLHLLRGDRPTAEQYFRKCVQTGQPTLTESMSAKAELASLRGGVIH